MENFLMSSRSFREYMEDGRVHWRNLVAVVFEHLNEDCQCNIEMLTKCGKTYERVRKMAKMIQYAYQWLRSDEEEKLRIEDRISRSTNRSKSKRYGRHMLRGINCLKKDNIWNFDDVAESLAEYQRQEKSQKHFSSERRDKRSASLKNRVLSIQELEKENDELRARTIEYLDEIEALKEVINRSNSKLSQISRELEDSKQAQALAKQAILRLRQEIISRGIGGRAA